MRILQLCNKPPLPASDGGALAMNAITEGLLEAGCEVKVLALATGKHPHLAERIPAGWQRATQFESVHADTRVKAWPAFLNLFGKNSYNVERFYSSAFEAKLDECLQRAQFDLVHLESLYMLPYLPLLRRRTNAPVVLRAHNVEHRIWRRLAQQERGWKKSWFSLLAKRLETYEREMTGKCDGLVAITPEDLADFRKMGFAGPGIHIPYALQLPEPAASANVQPDTVFHIGSMDWKPNLEGVRWLLLDVWPEVRRRNPNAVLYLAGRNMPQEMRELQEDGVRILGEVNDAEAFMRRYAVMAVPLLSGGGMRVKAVEAMALGKAIVGTAIGMEGIPAENGREAIIASDEKNFAEGLLRCLSDAELRRSLGAQARALATGLFERRRATEKLLDFYRQLLPSSSA